MTWYRDADHDKYGDAAQSVRACKAPLNYVAAAGDCDDAHANVHPGAAEVCDSASIDEDCNGQADDADPNATGKTPYYADADGDGVGSGVASPQCHPSPSHPVKVAGDCNDGDPAIKPGAVEVCDNANVDENCNGKADDLDSSATGKTKFYADKDGDGFGAGLPVMQCDPSAAYPQATAGDCNDASAAAHPGATEVCDAANLDEDCDGKADDNDPDASGKTMFYADKDLDKAGAGEGHAQCDPSAAYPAKASDDCDDAHANVHPGATEVCDAANVDEDCNGKADDADSNATGKVSYYTDADGDGVGAGAAVAQCDPSPAHPVRTSGDCDDTNAAVKPGAVEVCDGANVDENCNGKADDLDPTATGKTKFYADKDGDGYGAGLPVMQCDPSAAYPQATAGDCNDASAAAHPGATEVCDAANIDEDCDGKADDNDPDASGKTMFYADKDLDKAGAGEGHAQCDPSAAFPVKTDDDCDDAHANVHPGATEVCDAANVDEDCNGKADDADTNATGKVSYYADVDGDGVGAGAAVAQCDPSPAHPVRTSGDCDDTNAAIKPGAAEVCDPANADEDCDGKADDADPSATGKVKYYADKDADGHGGGLPAMLCDPTAAYPLTSADDCNDANAAVHPGATEVCDAKSTDEDCNGKADDLDPAAAGKALYYADHDLDKYGAGDGSSQCHPSAAFPVTANGDCDDAHSNVHPGAVEVCDVANVDEDCDGRADDADDEAQGRVAYYSDADGDGSGAGEASMQCDPSTAHPAKVAGDCDDHNPSVKPGATEVCDPSDVDEDCDGKADDADASASGKTAFYADRDQDGYGAGAAVQRCDAGGGYTVSTAGDCNDANAAIHPGAAEVCDPANADEDCDGKADNADDDAANGTMWYADADGDKHGAGAGAKKCDATPPYPVATSDDCDDTRANVHPGATEVCDAANLDEDCNGKADDADENATGKVAFYADDDKDTFGGQSAQQCDPSPQYPVRVGGDCNDRDASINPKATEVCDAADTDENCNGKADNADPGATGRSPYYADHDDDGYGAGVATNLCDPTAVAKATQNGDCNDNNANVNPGEVEQCDPANLDEDCNGKADNADPGARGATSWYLDGDRDGYGAGNAATLCDADAGHTAAKDGDCNDADRSINPGVSEVCDAKNVDEDCDGRADDDDDSVAESSKTAFYEDSDADGFGRTDRMEMRCDLPTGYAVKKDDCDDVAPHVHPGAPELCDGAFDDCSTSSRWTAASENGTISAQLKDGSWVDMRSSFPAAAPATPAAPWAAPADATLHVCAGTFYGRITVAAGGFTVIGTGGADQAHLAGSGTGSIIDMGAAAGALSVQGVTLSGGHSDFGGAIRGRSKAAISIDASALTGNSATMAGGALYVGRPSSVTIHGSTFTGNTTDGPGGAIATAIEAVGGSLVLDGATFRDNRAKRMGGAVDATTITNVAGTVFEGNQAQDAAGLACRSSGCEIRDTRFDGNVATGTGGGLYIAGKATDSMSIEKGIFSGNRAGAGGGAYLSGARVSVSDSTFEKNTGGTGGALLVDAGKITLSASTFSGNIAGGSAAGGNGGALYQSSGSLAIDGVTFTNNEARPGPGRGDGGAIYAPGGTLTIEGSTIDGNRASGAGGGLYVGQAAVTATGLTVTGNSSARGGGVYQTGSASRVTATNTTVRGNTSRSAPPISGQGGGWFLSAGAQGAITGGSQISENVVSTDSPKDGVLGGGVAVFGSDTKFSCKDSAITANNASTGSGVGQTMHGGGAYVGQGGAILSSAACEWGSDATDNAPDDVWVDYLKEPYPQAGSSLPFTCVSDARQCN